MNNPIWNLSQGLTKTGLRTAFKVAEHSFCAFGSVVQKPALLLKAKQRVKCVLTDLNIASFGTKCFRTNEMDLRNPRATNRGIQLNSSACAIARKIETGCLEVRGNLPICNDPVVTISRNLAKRWFRNHVNDLSRKI